MENFISLVDEQIKAAVSELEKCPPEARDHFANEIARLQGLRKSASDLLKNENKNEWLAGIDLHEAISKKTARNKAGEAMTTPVKVTINTPITIGKITIEPGTKMAVTFSADNKSVYIPNGKGGYVAKPACFVTVAK